MSAFAKVPVWMWVAEFLAWDVRAYTSIPSVAEILIPRSDRVSAELLRRDASGAWPEKPVAVSHGGVMLDSIGYSLDLAALYARTGLAP
jgi:hypothetical protein